MIIILPSPQRTRMTAGVWSLMISGAGLYLGGWLFAPIGIACGLFGLVAALCRQQVGQSLISLLGIVTGLVAMATSWTLWGLVLLGIAASQ